MLDDEKREYLLRLFKGNRYIAHKHLFPHRHKDDSPEFHHEAIALLNSPHPRVAEMAFRGGAKSTLLEEHVLLKLLFREEAYCLFVGPKWESACEHLEPIRNEIENNELILELFGDQRASPWTMDELGLANGTNSFGPVQCCVQSGMRCTSAGWADFDGRTPRDGTRVFR